MALPTKTELLTLNYSWFGEPFCHVPAKSSIDLATLDYSWFGEPFAFSSEESGSSDIELAGQIITRSVFGANATKTQSTNSSETTESSFDGLLSISRSVESRLSAQSRLNSDTNVARAIDGDVDGSSTSLSGQANLSRNLAVGLRGASTFAAQLTVSSTSGPGGVGNDLELWLETDTLTGLNNGDDVALWEDSSQGGNDATAAATSPIYNTDELNGYPSIRFNGSATQYFSLPDFLTSFSEGEVFIIAKADADPPAESFVGPTIKFGANGALLASHYPYSDGEIYDDFGSTLRKACGNPTLDLASDYRIVNIKSEANFWEYVIDGDVLFTTTTNSVAWTTTPKIGYDERYVLATSRLDIVAVIFFSRVLETTERQDVNTYLEEKYFPSAVAIEGEIDCQSRFSGSLSTSKTFVGSLSAESTFGDAAILKTLAEVSSVSGDGRFDGQLAKAAALTSTDSSASYFNASISLNRSIEGRIHAQSRFGGELQVDHTGVAELIGTLRVSSTFGSSALVNRNNQSSSAVDSVFNGLLSVVRSITGLIRCHSVFNGDLDSGHDTAPALTGIVRGSSNLGNTIRLNRGLQTGSSTDSTFDASVSVARSILGNVRCQSRFTGDLFSPTSLTGSMGCESEFTSRPSYSIGLGGSLVGDSGSSTGVLLHRELSGNTAARARFFGSLSISSLVATFEIVRFTLGLRRTKEINLNLSTSSTLGNLQITTSKSLTLER
jgi:hypothetical protein